MREPIVFEPIYMERVWGGRSLMQRFFRALPGGTATPIGESWELVDRPEAVSVVRSGPFEGESLHDLWMNRREQVFGNRLPDAERFPLLVKILDARQTLSIQVHPPESAAAELHGEPKTELWYVAAAEAGAAIFAGLRQGATRESFRRALADGSVEDLVHHIPIRQGDAMFLPSGRLHALGAGSVIFEIQQNSDTTYRVFDWNRVGLDGQPRALHVEEALRCIDFDDIEPELIDPEVSELARCRHFRVSRLDLESGETHSAAPGGRFAFCGVAEGRVSCSGQEFGPGAFFLIPADRSESGFALTAERGATVIAATIMGKR